jgi:hypothetical protein
MVESNMTRASFSGAMLACVLLAGCGEQSNMSGGSAGEIDVLAATESSRDFGDYVVHFNALTTDQLTPEIASEYDIVRSKNRALLNVSILRKQDNGGATAVSGAVAASAVNLTGQLKELLIREIRESDAIYYIAETPVTNGESLIFTLDVTPQNEASRFSVRFQKQFFVD